MSAVAYLLAGGYALLHRRHVRIDVVYALFSPRTRARVDLVMFVFFVIYVGALVWVGGTMAWTSFLQGETTGSPWNPPIWPVKAAIPLAGLLLLLQGIANLLREWYEGARADGSAMSIELLSLLFVGVFIVILLLGMPLAFATGVGRGRVHVRRCSACRG